MKCHLKGVSDLFQDDFMLQHYDKGPCKNRLGHSRASLIWHRTQVTLINIVSSCCN